MSFVNKHKPWSKIVDVIKNGSAYKPVLIFDISNNEFYFGTQENDTLYVQTLYANQGYALEINYDNITDKLTITSTEENYLTDVDAPKMYRHQLTLTFDGEYGSESLIVYSSSDLNVNSLENLTTLLKPDSNTLFYGNTITSITPYTFQIIYDNNVWKTGPMDEELGKPNSTITAVSDIVTPA